MREDGEVAGAFPVNSDAFAAFPVGEPKGGCHVCLGRGMREVDRLRDRVVVVTLECGLHPYVPLGSDLVRGDEQPLRPVRHFLLIRHAASSRHMVHHRVAIEATVFCGLEEVAVDFAQSRQLRGVVRVKVVLPRVGEREHGLDAGCAVGDDRDRPGRGHRCSCGVAVRATGIVHRAPEGRECSPLACKPE